MLTNTQILNAPRVDRQTGGAMEDSRPALDKFRRAGLYIILKHNGHDHITENMPYVEMLAYAKAHEHELTDEGLIITGEEYGGFKVQKPREVIEHEQKIDKEIQDKRQKYGNSEDAKTEEWDALRKEAAAAGIDITRMNFDEVVAVLVDAKKDSKSGYDTMSWPDLKKQAKERGIETHAKKKHEIIAALKGD